MNLTRADLRELEELRSGRLPPLHGGIALLTVFAHRAADNLLVDEDRAALARRDSRTGFHLQGDTSGMDQLEWLYRDERGRVTALLHLDAGGSLCMRYLGDGQIEGDAFELVDSLTPEDKAALRAWLDARQPS